MRTLILLALVAALAYANGIYETPALITAVVACGLVVYFGERGVSA